MSLWDVRDRPVLEYLAAHPPLSGLSTNELEAVARPDFPALLESEFHLAVETLHDAGYLVSSGDLRESGGGHFFQGMLVTGDGFQALKLWPGFGVLGSPAKLANVLDALASKTESADDRASLETAATQIRGTVPTLLRALVSGALRAVIQTHTGLP